MQRSFTGPCSPSCLYIRVPDQIPFGLCLPATTLTVPILKSSAIHQWHISSKSPTSQSSEETPLSLPFLFQVVLVRFMLSTELNCEQFRRFFSVIPVLCCFSPTHQLRDSDIHTWWTSKAEVLAVILTYLFWFLVNKTHWSKQDTYGFISQHTKFIKAILSKINQGRCTDLQDWNPASFTGQIRDLHSPTCSWKAGGGGLLISIYPR